MKSQRDEIRKATQDKRDDMEQWVRKIFFFFINNDFRFSKVSTTLVSYYVFRCF